MDNRSRIRELNDAFRRTFVGGKVTMTAGVAALPSNELAKVLSAVRTFKDFDGDNDPHMEHDFGSFDIDDSKFFWKIDYYDASMEGGSENPSDPAQTTRVLTIMFASEY